ncbi:unnamed protein product [Closterium sp. NIES-54]
MRDEHPSLPPHPSLLFFSPSAALSHVLPHPLRVKRLRAGVSGRRATNAFLKRLKSTPSAPSLISLRFSLSLSPQPQSDAPLPESSGYLQVFLDGGLNQQRISVCNAVAVARLLNATLLVPEFATNIFWQDSRWAAHRAAGG